MLDPRNKSAADVRDTVAWLQDTEHKSSMDAKRWFQQIPMTDLAKNVYAVEDGSGTIKRPSSTPFGPVNAPAFGQAASNRLSSGVKWTRAHMDDFISRSDLAVKDSCDQTRFRVSPFYRTTNSRHISISFAHHYDWQSAKDLRRVLGYLIFSRCHGCIHKRRDHTLRNTISPKGLRECNLSCWSQFNIERFYILQPTEQLEINNKSIAEKVKPFHNQLQAFVVRDRGFSIIGKLPSLFDSFKNRAILPLRLRDNHRWGLCSFTPGKSDANAIAASRRCRAPTVVF